MAAGVTELKNLIPEVKSLHGRQGFFALHVLFTNFLIDRIGAEITSDETLTTFLESCTGLVRPSINLISPDINFSSIFLLGR